MSRWLALACVSVICSITCVRIAATHSIFSPTYDEPLHVTSGYNFLVEHRYRDGTENPPLARAVFAFPLRSARPTAPAGNERATEIFESAGDYMAGVASARRGNLLFVVLAILGTAALAAEVISPAAAVVAAGAFALLPPVLAHGGLATTDIAGTAGFAFAVAAMFRWLQEPSWRWTALLGAAVALLLLTKFTTALFFAVAAVILILMHRRFPLRLAAAALVMSLAIVYTVYLYGHAAPRFLIGIVNTARYSSQGHDAYLLGEVRHTGWWYYFPLVLAVKTPIPFLLLSLIGMWLTFDARTHRWVTILTVAMLGPVLMMKANLGVRHVLPIYVPLSLLFAYAAVQLYTTRLRWVVVALGVWLVAGSSLAHPDYIPWMNAFAGSSPQKVVLDSNFDWGQDVLRLRDACRKRHIQGLGVELFGMTDLERIGMPPTYSIDPYAAMSGWFAISESFIIPAQVRDPEAYAWLTTAHDFERIGKSIRLYSVPSAKR
jgi:4-amino-4-deoxy-L-arabinose transferase-like glycosyltransferase